MADEDCEVKSQNKAARVSDFNCACLADPPCIREYFLTKGNQMFSEIDSPFDKCSVGSTHKVL